MKKFTFLLLLVIATTTVNAQFNQANKSGIIKYDFNTYKGSPIVKGWLFPDSTYRKLYISYNAADTAFKYYNQQSANLIALQNTFKAALAAQKTKNDADSTFRVRQAKSFAKLDSATNQSIKLTDKVLKDDKSKVSKFEAALIGIGGLFLGWVAGSVHH